VSSSTSYVMFNTGERFLDVKLSVRTFKENGWHFANCPELDLVDQGKTIKAAIANLHEMVITSLIEAIETDNIDSMLKALGFTRSKVPKQSIAIYNIPADKYENLFPLTFKAAVPPQVGMKPDYKTAVI